jgi:hypothetical protein
MIIDSLTISAILVCILVVATVIHLSGKSVR